MKFETAQSSSGSSGFPEALENDLAGQLEKLPLERFCKRGGWPLKPRISTIAILEDGPARLVAVLYVCFTETGAACCSGDNFEHEHFEELPMIIDKQGWTCAFPASV